MHQTFDGIGRSGLRRGSLGLYAMSMGLVTLFLVLVFFFPQFFRMKSGIYRISCKEIRRKVEVAVANYDANNSKSIIQPGKLIDIDHLKATGFLTEVQNCPEKGKYIFGPQGEILCTIHRPSAKQPADVDTGS